MTHRVFVFVAVVVLPMDVQLLQRHLLICWICSLAGRPASLHFSESYVCFIYNSQAFLLYLVGGIEKITSILLEAGALINIQLCRILQFGRIGWPHTEHSFAYNTTDKRHPHNGGILGSYKGGMYENTDLLTCSEIKKNVTELL